MLGATETTIGPDVAPVGIVMLMDVAPHVLIVTGVPFKITMLPFCDPPNPEPKIVTWLPIGPVVADRLVITGAEDPDPGALTDTLSNVAVAKLEVEPLLTGLCGKAVGGSQSRNLIVVIGQGQPKSRPFCVVAWLQRSRSSVRHRL